MRFCAAASIFSAPCGSPPPTNFSICSPKADPAIISSVGRRKKWCSSGAPPPAPSSWSGRKISSSLPLRGAPLSLAKLPAIKQARRLQRVRHPRVAAVILLVLATGGLSFAIFSGHRHEKSPGSTVSRPVTTLTVQSPAESSEKSAERTKPVEEAALRPPPPLAAASGPAWVRYAVPAPPTGNRPLVAVVIDDLGLDRARTAEVIRLHGPLTLSFMTYASELGEQTDAAREAGHELFLHVPMEAVDRRADPGPHGLFTSQSRDEILDRLRWGLGRFDGFVGINNHMGSKFTSDLHSMAPVMEELH